MSATPTVDLPDVFGAVLLDALATVQEQPWPVALLALMAVSAVVRTVRAIVHGRHPRDPVRRFCRVDKRVVLERAGHRCEHHSVLDGRCRATEDLQADHVHPHSRGGSTSVDNGQALCARHNRRKSARVPWNWQLARLARRRERYFPRGASTAVVRHCSAAGVSSGMAA